MQIIKTDNFREYNNDINNLHVKDAVKVTSSSNESFWVEIKKIRRKKIIGKVCNMLLNHELFNLNDLITFEIKHIKEHKLEANRFPDINDPEMQILKNKILMFMETYGRTPTLMEIEEHMIVEYRPIENL